MLTSPSSNLLGIVVLVLVWYICACLVSTQVWTMVSIYQWPYQLDTLSNSHPFILIHSLFVISKNLTIISPIQFSSIYFHPFLVCHIQKPHNHFPHLSMKEDSLFVLSIMFVCHVQISQITMLLTMLLVPLESPSMSSGVYLVGFIMFWPNDGKS